MRTRPASLATIVIAIGLALTTIGISRGLPHTFAGVGSRSTIAADVWAHGTAISPSLVALLFVGLLAAIAMRPTRGGRRASLWLAILAGALFVTGLLESAQRDAILFTTIDVVTPVIWALHLAIVGLVLSALGETRRAPRSEAGGVEGVAAPRVAGLVASREPAGALFG